MIIKSLEIKNYRLFEYAEFDFREGMNLVVGVNGAGKTTTLDALRLCLSRIIDEVTLYRGRGVSLRQNDFSKKGESMVRMRCGFVFKDIPILLDFFKGKGSTWETADFAPMISRYFPQVKQEPSQPLVLHFSTRRSHAENRTYKKPNKIEESSQALAYQDALRDDRAFNTRIIADWILTQEELTKESSQAERSLNAVLDAAVEFLPDYGELKARKISREKSELLIKKGNDYLNVNQLSDGERNMLVLAVDIARRLAMANPELENPLKEGKGVILIDELDLHLHPQWQRKVVKQLTTTFPKCQFIASTHSPQLIGEVPAERITIIDNGEIYRPSRSFGLDSSRVLEEIMDTPERNEGTEKKLEKLGKLISYERFDEARGLIKLLELELGEDSPEIIRANTMLSFLDE